MKRTKFFFLFLLLCLFLGFLVREIFFVQTQPFQIFCEKKAALVSNGDEFSRTFFVFGNSDSPALKMISGHIGSFFNKPQSFLISEQPENKQLSFANFSLQVFSKTISRGVFLDSNSHTHHSFWFWDVPSETEILNLKSQPIPFDSDFWILQNSQFPDFFPAPKMAIAFLGERKPSDTLVNFARDNHIPLITVQDTDGFSFTRENKEWQLKTRK